MKKNKKKILLMLSPLLIALTLFYSQTVGVVALVTVELFSLGQADCRVWSDEKPLMVCSSSPVFLHARGGTQFGDTFVTSADRTNLTNELISHEQIHKKQQQQYGVLFIPLYFSQNIFNPCGNSFEEEAGYYNGYYHSCVGTEQYRNSIR